VIARGLGYKRDVPDERDFDAFDPTPGKPRLFAARASMTGYPDTVDHASAVTKVHDQGGSSSCVAQSGCNAVELYQAIRGVHLLELSRRAAYDWARGGKPPFADEGAFPRTAMDRWQAWGFTSAARWGWDESRINEGLPFDVVKAGADARVQSYYRITGTGADRCQKMRVALAEGFPILIGADVYEDFANYTGGVLDGKPQGELLGGHATCVLGYAPGQFHVLNSWGYSWGENGLYRVSDTRMGSDDVSDVWVFTSAPTVIR